MSYTFDDVNARLQSLPRTQINVEKVEGIFDPTETSWGHVEGFGEPAYAPYPQDDVFPYKHMVSLATPALIVLYTGAKFTKTFLGTGSKYLVDLGLIVFIVGTFLDVLVTTNGTYVGHKKGGLEGNPNIRQWSSSVTALM